MNKIDTSHIVTQGTYGNTGNIKKGKKNNKPPFGCPNQRQ